MIVKNENSNPDRKLAKHPFSTHHASIYANAFYEKVIKVKADVAAFLINCFPSA